MTTSLVYHISTAAMGSAYDKLASCVRDTLHTHEQAYPEQSLLLLSESAMLVTLSYLSPIRLSSPVSLSSFLQERNAAIIRAEGESEAAKLISEATKAAGTGLVELRRIEAAKDIAETMSKSQNVVYLPNGNNMLLGLNTR